MTRHSPPTDVLSILDIASELPEILRRADRLKAARRRGILSPTLRGRNLAMIFEKPSTRTRTSFEVAMNDLGGHALYLSTRDLQLGRGETIADTARVLSRYVDAVCYRAFRHSDVVELARWADVPVINALDDLEHPCQIVADLLTMHERWNGRFHGHRLTWIGDGNNVLHSLLLGAAAVGLDLTAATPAGYRPRTEIVESAQSLARGSGAHLAFTDDPKEAARGADALYTDVWVSMGEAKDVWAERVRMLAPYQVNADLMRKARNPAVKFMHCLPAFHDANTVVGREIMEHTGASGYGSGDWPTWR